MIGESDKLIRNVMRILRRYGGMFVPENHWFIWPNLAITGNLNVGEASISSVMLQMASVPETQFVGKPFKRWFWREQILP